MRGKYSLSPATRQILLPYGVNLSDCCKEGNFIKEILTKFLRKFGELEYADMMMEHLEQSVGGRKALRAVVERYLGDPGRDEFDDKAVLDEMAYLLAAYGPSLKRRTAAKLVAERHSGTIKGNSPEAIESRLDRKFSEFEQERRQSGEYIFYTYCAIHTEPEIRQILAGAPAEQDSRLQDLIRTWPRRYGRTTTDGESALLVAWVRRLFDHPDLPFNAGAIEEARSWLENLVHQNPPPLSRSSKPSPFK